MVSFERGLFYFVREKHQQRHKIDRKFKVIAALTCKIQIAQIQKAFNL